MAAYIFCTSGRKHKGKSLQSHSRKSDAFIIFRIYQDAQRRVAILKARLDDQSHLTSKLKWLSLGLFKGGLFVWRDKSLAHSASRGRECPVTSTLSIPSLWQRRGGFRPILVFSFVILKCRNFCHAVQFIIYFSYTLIVSNKIWFSTKRDSFTPYTIKKYFLYLDFLSHFVFKLQKCAIIYIQITWIEIDA